MEDLWEFNNEELAYAIRASKIPIVSAVGHEIDVTISDLAADMRAPTPSAAAELLVAEKETIEKRLGEIRERMINSCWYYLVNIRESLKAVKKGLKDPRREIADTWLRLDELEGRLKRQISVIINDYKNKIREPRASMFVNSPVKKIERYREAIIYKEQLLTRSIKRVMDAKRKGFDILKEKMNDLTPTPYLTGIQHSEKGR
jgi:exodeoxyribonuclease VII large subunit